MPSRPLHAARKAIRPLHSYTRQRTFARNISISISQLHSTSLRTQSTRTRPRQSLTSTHPLTPSLPNKHTRSHSMAAPSSGVTPETLTATLNASPDLAPLHVDIQDISGGCGQSFAAVIVSDKFLGKSTLQRHRLVNGVLREEIKAIHAWTPRCLSGEQWEKEKQKTV